MLLNPSRGIRVNCVNPGTADTPWVQRLLASASDPEVERASAGSSPAAGAIGDSSRSGRRHLLLSKPTVRIDHGNYWPSMAVHTPCS